MPAGFRYILVFRVKRENKWMKTVYHQIYKGKREYDPRRIEQGLAPAPSLVQISDNITYPHKHRQEHKNKIKDAVRVQERKKPVCFMMFIQKSPCYIRNEVKA